VWSINFLPLHGHAPAVVFAAERLGDALQKLDARLQLGSAWAVVGIDHQEPVPARSRLYFRLVTYLLQRQRTSTTCCSGYTTATAAYRQEGTSQ